MLTRLCCFAKAAALRKSTRYRVGFVGVSTYRQRVRGVTSFSIPSSDESTWRTVIPKRGKKSRIRRYAPPYTWEVEITSSPCFKTLSKELETAAMPAEVTTASSAPSSAAIFFAAASNVGLASRVYIYALLLPSAQRFSSSVEFNAKVEERTIADVTGASTPCREGSPA